MPTMVTVDTPNKFSLLQVALGTNNLLPKMFLRKGSCDTLRGFDNRRRASRN